MCIYRNICIHIIISIIYYIRRCDDVVTRLRTDTLHPQLYRKTIIYIYDKFIYIFILYTMQFYIIIETTQIRPSATAAAPGFERDFDCECHLNNMRNYAKYSQQLPADTQRPRPSPRRHDPCRSKSGRPAEQIGNRLSPRHYITIFTSTAPTSIYT